MQPSEMASLSYSRYNNGKERPNRSTYKGYLFDKAKRDVSEGVSL